MSKFFVVFCLFFNEPLQHIAVSSFLSSFLHWYFFGKEIKFTQTDNIHPGSVAAVVTRQYRAISFKKQFD
jgi:hypothetical protein